MKSNLISTYYLIIVIFLFLLCSCVDNYYESSNTCQDCTGNGSSTSTDSDSTSGSKETYRVIFLANVDEEAVKSSSTTPLQQNRYVVIYTFVYKEDYVSTTDYVTQQAGILTPVSGNALTLVDGKYEFYGLSVGNKSIYPPSVTDLSTGIVSGLSNGIDYLTTQSLPNTISGNTTIDLTFSHACTQVMVKIIPEDTATIKIDSITSAQISQPTTSGNILSLYTGIISSSKSLQSSMISMFITGDTCHQILLPMALAGPLNMDFSVYLNGETAARSYSTNIPVVNSQLLAGSSYFYEIEIDESTVTFNTVNVKDWTEVNESGTPLNPTPE